MELYQCTKEELIFIINRLAQTNFVSEEQRKRKIKFFLSEVAYKRAEKTLSEAENWAKIAAENNKKYYDFLKTYEGTKSSDIPAEAVKEAEAAINHARHAEKKWSDCMRKVDGYTK